MSSVQIMENMTALRYERFPRFKFNASVLGDEGIIISRASDEILLQDRIQEARRVATSSSNYPFEIILTMFDRPEDESFTGIPMLKSLEPVISFENEDDYNNFMVTWSLM